MSSRKGTRVGDPAVSFALSSIRKDALIDLIYGLAMERLGPGAPEAEVVAQLQRWVDGIREIRDEEPVSLAEIVARYRRLYPNYWSATGPPGA